MVSGFTTRATSFSNHHPSERIISPRRLESRRFAILEKDSGGKARFSGVESDRGFTNVFDYVLGLISSDIGSIVLGLLGLTLAVGHRFAEMDSLSSETLAQETRSDLLAVFASGAVLLNGISKLDVTSALAEAVPLDGTTLPSPVFQGATNKKQSDLIWALESALAATPAKSVALLEDEGGWCIKSLAGVVPKDPLLQKSVTPNATPILDRFRTDSSKETYLPTLQALPGRVEFTYLPPNTQGVLLLPVPVTRDDSVSVLVLGTDTAKSFSPRDVAWCQVLASRIGTFLDADY